MSGLKTSIRELLLGAYDRVHVWRKLREVEERDPILVYQMGKVGSSSVVSTLRKSGISNPVLHVHTLRRDELQSAIRKHTSATNRRLPEHLLTSGILIDRIAGRRFPCKVITLTREPVGRVVSFAFEDWRKKLVDGSGIGSAFDPDHVQSVCTRLLSEENGHSDPGRWFDRELNQVLGVDVFSKPYDPDSGYVILESGPVSTLVIRMEDLNTSLTEALAKFLDIETGDVRQGRANKGADKWYADALKASKQTYRLPPVVANAVMNTRYFKHFYSRDEQSIRDKWVESGAHHSG